MSVELLERKGSTVRFKVTVEPSDVEAAVKAAVQHLSRSVKIPGFRPGKAPRSILESRVGADTVLQEARDALIEMAYPRAIQELKLIPVDNPKVSPAGLIEGEHFTFETEVEIYPEVDLADYRNLKLEAKALPVTPEMIDEAIASLRNARAEYDPVNRPVGNSDLVTVETVQAAEGQEASTLNIDLDRAADGLRDLLVGSVPGDEREIPIDSGSAEASSQKIKIIVREVKVKRLPELDDEFAKALGLDDLAAVRKVVEVDLERQSARAHRRAIREEFTRKLAEGAKVELPRALIERRKRSLLQDLIHRLEDSGVTYADYRAYLEREGRLQEFEADLERQATLKVTTDLALEALAERLSTAATDEEANKAVADLAEQSGVSIAQMRQRLGADGLDNLKSLIAREKAVDLALAEALGE